jgi:serine/threonine protein kinase
MAPEILKGFPLNITYTKNVDVWSLGILIYFLCCKTYPFIGSDPHSIYEKIM